jgi:lauroyl/myristoyl acyltransferase
MKIYVFNTLITPCNFSESDEFTVRFRKIDKEKAKEILKNNEFVSAVGHQATADLLTAIMGVHIPMNRIAVRMGKGDIGVHFFLKQRLPEGTVLGKDELDRLSYDLILSEIN